MSQHRGFEAARKVEAEGKRRLAPWFDHVAHDGRWVWIASSRLERFLQTQAGDSMLATSQFESVVVEIKIQSTSRDAAYEIWSNKVLMGDGKSVDMDASNPGWGPKCKADLILVYTLASDSGVIGSPARWREFLNQRSASGIRNGDLYEMRSQSKYAQRNHSVVLFTPMADLIEHAGFVRVGVRQLELFEKANPVDSALKKGRRRPGAEPPTP